MDLVSLALLASFLAAACGLAVLCDGLEKVGLHRLRRVGRRGGQHAAGGARGTSRPLPLTVGARLQYRDGASSMRGELRLTPSTER